MKKLIEDFTKHLSTSLSLAERATLNTSNNTINNVLLCGLGGSGIGATIITQVVSSSCKLPITVNKDYKIPAFVGEHTLVICCSYSGNTEETLEMLEQAQVTGAEIACITSGGKLEEIAAENNYNCIVIEGGHPPRAAFGLSFPHLFKLFHHYGVIEHNYFNEFLNAIKTIDSCEGAIQEEAQAVTAKLVNKIPIIYADANYEGVATRLRQQINENSKMLCWHHVIPEMNHNELVGWTNKNEDLAVVMLRNDDDYRRTQVRMGINKTVFQKYTSTIIEIYSKGNSRLEKMLYLIHLGDWISYFLGEHNGVDIVEVDVITYLKSELAKV